MSLTSLRRPLVLATLIAVVSLVVVLFTISRAPFAHASSVTAIISANPSSVSVGGATQISFHSSDYQTICKETFDPADNKTDSGTISLNPTTTTVYSVTCGASTNTVTVQVVSTPAPVITSFYTNPSTITPGNSSSLSWNTTNASSCTLSSTDGAFNGGSSGTSGNYSVSPTTNTTYTLKCSGTGGNTSATTNITIGTPVPLGASCYPSTSNTSINTPVNWNANAWGGKAPYNYSWSGDDLSGSATTETVDYGTTGTKKGTVTVTDSGAGPSPTINWTSYTVCSGSPIGGAVQYDELDSGNQYAANSEAQTNGQNTYTDTQDDAAAGWPADFNVNPQNYCVEGDWAEKCNPSNYPSGPVACPYLIEERLYSGNGITSVPSSFYSNADYAQYVGTNIYSPAGPTSRQTTTAICSTTVNVTAPAASVNFYANPVSITQGQSSTLSWSSSNATSCSIDNGIGGVNTSGSTVVTPGTTTTYNITCTGQGSPAYGQATIYVTPLSPNLYPSTPANVTVYAGQPATLSYSVINGGNGTSGTAQNIFWIDWNPSANAWNSTAYTYSAPISPGGSQYQSTTYTWNTAGTYYYDECVNVSGGGGPTYTCGTIGTVTVLPPLLPNITASTGNPMTGQLGQPFSGFSGSVYNTGNANAPTFPNTFQICDGNCATINTYIPAQSFGLAAGANQSVSPVSSYTPTTMSPLYYRLCGDINTSGNATISESNYGDNCGGWQNFTITAPDLTASAGASASGVVGQQIGLSGMVSNIGNASTISGFYNNLQVTYANQSTVLANDVWWANAESSGGSQVYAVNQVFPSAGTYYYRMCADENAGFQGTIQESNEGNNCSGWVPVYISSPSGTISANPNPCTISSGNSCTSNISWNSNSTAVEVWVSPNGGTAQDFSNASPSGSANAPWIGTPGYDTFTLYDYTSGSRGAVLGSVTVSALEANITAASGPAMTGAYGQPTTLTGSVTNTGSASAGYFPNIIQVCDGGCATVNSTVAATAVGGLGSGASQSVSGTYTPTTTNPLYYRICADTNTSWQNVISESNYGDNCSNWQNYTVGEPDLIPANAPQNITTLVNQPFTMINTVQNVGTAATPSGFPNSFWVDTNAILNAGDAWNTSAGGNLASLNSYIGNTLGVGATQQISASYTIATPGTYYYAYCTNIGANWSPAIAFPESNTGNNCWGWGTITVTAPDLTATAGSAVSITPSQSIAFTGTVTNSGNGATSGGFWNLLQICSGSGSCSTYNDASQEVWTSTLAGGGSAPVSITDTGPATPGSYVYRICANENTAWTPTVVESNYNNNCSGWQTLTVAYPAVAGSCTVLPTTAYAGNNITWTASPSGGNGTYAYQWGGNVSGSSQSVTTYYASPGTYSGQVRVTSAGLSNTFYCSPSVTINSCAPTLTASPSSIVAGQTTTLTWSEPSACSTSCTLSDGYSGGNTGSQVVTPPTNATTQTYAVTCSGNNGTTNVNQTSLSVAIPTATISASPARVTNPGTSIISYTATNVSSCEIYKNGVAWYAPSVSGNAASGSQTDSSITTQSTYKIVCSSAGITATAQTIVNVVPKVVEF